MTLKVVAAIAVTQYTALPKTSGHVWYVGTTWRDRRRPIRRVQALHDHGS
jgi:hypothetical protein